jgi:GntR family transcriptional regulator
VIKNQNHRYREIANQLFAEIRSGTFGIGERIPTEHAISRDFGVSRNTARHAVQELERLGLISRRRGAGSVVVKTDPKPTFISSVASISDLLQYVANTRISLTRVRKAIALPAVDGVPAQKRPQDWTHVEGIRFVLGSETPICATDIFLHPDVADIALDIGREATPVYRLIEERHHIVVHSIVQTIEAVVITGDEAQDLGAQEGSAGLKVIRAYTDFSGRVVEIAVNVYPAANLSYRMTILRNLDTPPIEPRIS